MSRRRAGNAELRRLAIQIAGQLPEDREEAVKVLEFTGELVRSFLWGDPDAEFGAAKVKPLRAVP